MKNIYGFNIKAKEEYAKTKYILEKILEDADFIENVESIAKICVKSLNDGGKIIFCGNGGSAADAQHLAGELVSRFLYERSGMSSVALTTDTSILTAISNDYGYDEVFSRQLQAIGKEGDILFGISTSGKSKNVTNAFSEAKKRGIVTVGMLGEDGNDIGLLADYCINIPANYHYKIQEFHIMTGHIICGIIEETIFGKAV